MGDVFVAGELASDQSVPDFWRGLGLPGLLDIHVHFLPPAIMARVWEHFDAAGPLIGGLVALGHLLPGGVGGRRGAGESRGGRLRVQGARAGRRLRPRHPLLDDVWGQLADAGSPVVIDAGSGPVGNVHTGPEPIAEVLRRHPALTAVIAHAGAPEYREFLALAETYSRVHLDTTMVFTPFFEEMAPFPPDLLPGRALSGSPGRCCSARTSGTSRTRTPSSWRAWSDKTSATTGCGRSAGTTRPR